MPPLCENAVANSLAAVQAGVRQVQGTINGLGERCGNANLMSLIPSFFLKKDFSEKFELSIKRENLKKLTQCSRLLDEILNRKPNKPNIVPEKIATPSLSSSKSLKLICGSESSSFSRKERDESLIILL